MHNSTDLGRYSLQPLLSIQLLVLIPQGFSLYPLKTSGRAPTYFTGTSISTDVTSVITKMLFSPMHAFIKHKNNPALFL